MATRVETGNYTVGESGDRSAGVIRGDIINQKNDGPFERIIGVCKSKWYVYELVEIETCDRDGRGVTYTTEIASLKSEHFTKSEALAAVPEKYSS